LERVGGERILDRVAQALTDALGIPPLLIANDAEAAGWRPDLRLVPDVRSGQGSLGGLYTAVIETPAPVVCVAWDMPFVSAPLLRALADGLAGHDALLPWSSRRHGVEPMCAAYGPGCREAIAASLDAGDLRAVAFHPRISVGILPLSELRRFGDPERLFFNVNTADDLARADGLWRRPESSR
jgi:molybdopterin-guanine dinucleotide biosynthesis protein A